MVSAEPGRRARPAPTVRVMTYNVHRCVGLDRRLAPERIAEIIAAEEPDVVALQELDVGRRRTRRVDQAHVIAQELEMAFHFQAAYRLAEEAFGDAIMSRLPMRLVHAGQLPRGLTNGRREPRRGALWVAVEAGGCELQVLNTHLSLFAKARLVQTETLLGPEWLAHPDCRAPVVLCGDFNAVPSSPVCRRLRERFKDVQIAVNGRRRPRKTWMSRVPLLRIDHVFVDFLTEVVSADVVDGELARVASDHLPLVVELRPGAAA